MTQHTSWAPAQPTTPATDAPAHRVDLRVAAAGASDFVPSGTPTLSWKTVTSTPGWMQSSAVIEIDRDGVIDEHLIEGSLSVDIPWPAADIPSYGSARVRVTVAGAGTGTGTDDSHTLRSEWVPISTGPLDPSDWVAAFISSPAADDESTESRPTTRFRRVISVDRPVKRALLSVTAHGIVDTVIDGIPVSSDVLAPGWTAYEDRLVFSTYDVTGQLGIGEHVLGATVADGWFGERFGFDGRFERVWHGPRSLIAQLRLEFEDGTIATVATDDSWLCTNTGSTTYASLYQGEHFDARNIDTALSNPAADVVHWTPVLSDHAAVATLEPASAPPVRVIETLRPLHTLSSPSGATIIDFGQNIAGWVRVTIAPGEPVIAVIRHAEVLEDGELGTRPLRFAAATDQITTTSEELQWRPSFTYHGFRFVQVDGVDPARIQVVAEVVHTDMRRTGWIHTSNTDVNKLHENAVWSYRGNAVSLPTDCPQRDERLGWSGDIQVFAPAASFVYDSDAFLRNWLQDLAADQRREGGVVPIVSPSLGAAGFPSTPMAAWSDAITLVPWTLWERFGDRSGLATLYDSMKAWVEVVRGQARDDLWERGFQLGDWLDPTAPPQNPAKARTSSAIVASAYYFRSTQTLARTAAVLGHTDDAETYTQLAERIRAAFTDTYVTANGRMVSDAHTGYALVLAFDIVTDDALRTKLGARLAEIVRSHGYRIGTGFVGTPIICDALARAGQRDVAHRLLLERDCPSWMYPISMGATTIWERWDSMLPDGSINPGQMTSFNHYALGAVIDWLHRDIGGIAPASPGYQDVLIRPRPGLLTSSESTFEGPYGTIRVRWTLTEGVLHVDVTVPPNSRATVDLSDDHEPVQIGSGEHHFEIAVAALPSKPPLNDQSSLADVVDDPQARAAFVAQLRSMGYPMADALSAEGMWRSDSLLADGLPMLPAAAVPALVAALQGTDPSHPRTD